MSFTVWHPCYFYDYLPCTGLFSVYGCVRNVRSHLLRCIDCCVPSCLLHACLACKICKIFLLLSLLFSVSDCVGFSSLFTPVIRLYWCVRLCSIFRLLFGCLACPIMYHFLYFYRLTTAKGAYLERVRLFHCYFTVKHTTGRDYYPARRVSARLFTVWNVQRSFSDLYAPALIAP